MITKTFQRYELKYLITPQQFTLLQQRLTEMMQPDDYCVNGSYPIYNVYYDTWDDALIRHSLQKPSYKEKLRMRSYQLPVSQQDPVFLELKKKVGGIVAKRRAVLPYGEALRYLERGPLPQAGSYEDAQVLREIEYFRTRFTVQPRVFIGYERIAYFDREDPQLRISFDFRIRTRRVRPDFLAGGSGTPLLTDGSVLMEIKCGGAMPLWLCHLLAQQQIYKTSFSKYGAEYTKALAQSALPNAMEGTPC